METKEMGADMKQFRNVSLLLLEVELMETGTKYTPPDSRKENRFYYWKWN